MRPRTFSDKDITQAQLAVSAVAMEFGTPHLSLKRLRRRGTDMVLARQLAMYLLRSVFGSPFVNIAKTFDRHPTTVSHAIRMIEDERDDPVLDAKIARLEDFLYGAKHEFG